MGRLFRVAMKATSTGKDRPARGICTEPADGKVHCAVCGCPVRSKLGNVCSKPRCHARATSRGER